jgi:protein SPT2
MRSAVKRKASTSQPVRLSNGYSSKNTLSAQQHAEAKIDSTRKDALSNRERVVSRGKERMHSIIRNESNQACASKTTGQKLPSKGSIATRHPSKDVNDSSLRKSSVLSRHYLSEVGRPQSSQSQRMPSSVHRQQHPSHDQRPHQSVEQRPEQSQQSQRPQPMSQGQRSQQSLQSQRMQQSMQSQRQHQSSLQKSQPSQNHRPQLQSYRPQTLQGQRPIFSQGQYSEQRRAQPNNRLKLVEQAQQNNRLKLVERQIRPPSKPMVIFMRKCDLCVVSFKELFSAICHNFVFGGILAMIAVTSHLFLNSLFVPTAFSPNPFRWNS